MPYFTWVDKETCIACGLCGAIAENVFDYDDEGLAYGKLDCNKGTSPIPTEDEEEFMEAYESCPTESIKKQSSPYR
ncbi:ferredoxin [Gracilibacillus ureilyticus]|nr:ferredoxin [Gracilibacillus ureilyticus]